jgi:hypothetical protein
MFTQDSALVKIWVDLIKTNKYTEDEIPHLSNLRDVVLSLI